MNRLRCSSTGTWTQPGCQQTYYSDGSNKLATSLIVVDSIPLVEGWLGIAYLGYSALLDEKEARRTQNVEQKIAMLQRLKAEQHCFQ